MNIKIDKKLCKSCSICIAICPRKVLEMKIAESGERTPFPTYINNCIGCKQCELFCPDFALMVEEE